jgi:predicted MFS family arabinose efflux permease
MAALVLFLKSRTLLNEKRSVPDRFQAMDFLGFVLFSGAIIQLLLALRWAGFEYVWRSSIVIGIIVGFGATAVAFVAWQLHLGEEAALPPHLFKKRVVYIGESVTFFGNGGLFVVLYYFQVWFQAVKGVSALKSGIMYLPTVGADVTRAIMNGVLGDRCAVLSRLKADDEQYPRRLIIIPSCCSA